MKRLIPLALIVLSAGNAAAQSPMHEDLSNSWSAAATKIIIPELVETSPQSRPQAPLLTIAYFDPQAEVRSVGVHTEIGDRKLISLTQRYTLPTSSGYLDHIQIHFDSSDGNSIYLGIASDQIGNNWTTGKPFHYAFNTFHGAEMKMKGFEGQKNFTIKIPVGHVAVPKEFHIMLSTPEAVSMAGTSAFALYGQVHVGREPVFDSARSGYTFKDSKNKLWNDVLDGMIKVDGQPLGIDFRMSAFVDLAPASVSDGPASRTAIYPNPVLTNGALHITNIDAITAISIRNMLGNEVMNWQGNQTNLDLSTSSLAKGVYNVLITTDEGIAADKLIIQ